MNQNNQRLGKNGFCICPKCGSKFPHHRGTPCQEERCTNCGAKLLRENSYHHELFKKKKT